MKQRVDRKKLRKQPRRYRARTSSAVHLPEVHVPKGAKKRKRRQKTKPLRAGFNTVKKIVFSSRWLSLGLLALTIYALVIIARDQRFYLNYIPVDGTVSVTTDEVVAVSGLAGNHIFSAEPGKAAENIADIPGIISSTVTLRWPNQVFIQVAEELPVAVWQENDIEYGITESGRLIPAGYSSMGLFKIISEMNQKIEAPQPLEELTDEGTEEVVETELETAETAAAEEVEEVEIAEVEETNIITPTITLEDSEGPALAFIPEEVLVGAMQLRNYRPTIGDLYYRPYGGLSFEDDRGWRGYFGTGTDMNQKLVIYETIAEQLANQGIHPTFISVSNQEKPYYGTR